MYTSFVIIAFWVLSKTCRDILCIRSISNKQNLEAIIPNKHVLVKPISPAAGEYVHISPPLSQPMPSFSVTSALPMSSAKVVHCLSSKTNTFI